MSSLNQEIENIVAEANAIYSEQERLSRKMADLNQAEIKLRVQLMFENKLLSTAKWTYDRFDRLSSNQNKHPGVGEAMGRFWDHHAYIDLEPGVQLCFCDNDLMLLFDKFRGSGSIDHEGAANLMRDFIKKWSIKIDTSHIKDKHAKALLELHNIETMLAEMKRLNGD